MNLPQNEGQSKALVYLLIGVAVIVVGIIAVKKIFGGIDGALEGLGLKDSKDEKKDKKEVEQTVDRNNALGNQSAWSPKMYKSVSGGKLFTVAGAKSLCKTIYDSVGHIYDEPNKAAGAIKQAYTKTQVSFLCDIWQQTYGTDLLSWLQLHFDTGEQKKVLNNILTYVEALPLAKPK